MTVYTYLCMHQLTTHLRNRRIGCMIICSKQWIRCLKIISYLYWRLYARMGFSCSELIIKKHHWTGIRGSQGVRKTSESGAMLLSSFVLSNVSLDLLWTLILRNMMYTLTNTPGSILQAVGCSTVLIIF